MSSRRQRKNVQLSNEENFDDLENMDFEAALGEQQGALSDQNHPSAEPDAIPRVE